MLWVERYQNFAKSPEANTLFLSDRIKTLSLDNGLLYWELMHGSMLTSKPCTQERHEYMLIYLVYNIRIVKQSTSKLYGRLSTGKQRRSGSRSI